jgi:hypothetical protein
MHCRKNLVFGTDKTAGETSIQKPAFGDRQVQTDTPV